jgi:hypothetical protein
MGKIVWQIRKVEKQERDYTKIEITVAKNVTSLKNNNITGCQNGYLNKK